MRRQKKSKQYKNQYLNLLAMLIGTLLIYHFILSLSAENTTMNIITTVLTPVIMAFFAFGIGRIDKSNADIDLKIHQGADMIRNENCPIWLIPNIQYVTKRIQFLEIVNIGETVISRISLIFGEAKHNYGAACRIQYPIHKGERLFVAIDDNIDVSVINVIYVSYGFDDALTFCGEMFELQGYHMFSEQIGATKDVKVREKYLTTCKRACLEQIICSEHQQNEEKILGETTQVQEEQSIM